MSLMSNSEIVYGVITSNLFILRTYSEFTCFIYSRSTELKIDFLKGQSDNLATVEVFMAAISDI